MQSVEQISTREVFIFKYHIYKNELRRIHRSLFYVGIFLVQIGKQTKIANFKTCFVPTVTYIYSSLYIGHWYLQGLRTIRTHSPPPLADH